MHPKITLLLAMLLSYSLSGQDRTPYNDDFSFKAIDAKTILPKIEGLKALIIDFQHTGDELQSFKQTLINNPEIVEIQLFHANQRIIDLLNKVNLKSLEYLFIQDSDEQTLTIPSFPGLTLLSIEADRLVNLDMKDAQLDKLLILAVFSSQLENWSCDPTFGNLELIDLNAPLLEYFPIEKAPKLFQFSFYCSLRELPDFTCNCPDLKHISYENYWPVTVPECMKTKVQNAFYSNITIYNGFNGDIVEEHLSEDKKNEE
jgi:hypothetical protein